MDLLNIFRQYQVPFVDPCNEDYKGICSCSIEDLVTQGEVTVCGTSFMAGTSLLALLSCGGGDTDWLTSSNETPTSISQDIYTLGNVGIGIQNPTFSLDIVGSGIRWENKFSVMGAIPYLTLGTNVQLRDSGTSFIRGKLDIGTPLDSSLLSVSGNIRFSGQLVDSDGNTGTAGEVLVSNGLGKNLWQENLATVSAGNGLTYNSQVELGGTITKPTVILNPSSQLTIGTPSPTTGTMILQGTNVTGLFGRESVMDIKTEIVVIPQSYRVGANKGPGGNIASQVQGEPEFIQIISTNPAESSYIRVEPTGPQISLREYASLGAALADSTLPANSLFRVTGDNNLKIK
jgi:hypothetical protein